MGPGVLKIATCQFAVSGHVARNATSVCRYIAQASAQGGDLVHFPECSLTGYPGVDIQGFDGYDWPALKAATERVTACAAEHRVWVVLGSAHRLETTAQPHNCLYLITPDGRIQDRYDKRFCMPGEAPYYTPGDHEVVFTVNGVCCGLLICFEVRFPEIYRPLQQQGVQCVIQSFYNARQSGSSVHSDIMPATMQTRAASNAMWASMSNASGHYSPYGSCFIQPDGKIVARLPRNEAGLMTNRVDVDQSFYDPMQQDRPRAMTGLLRSSDKPLNDPRSKDRTCL